jgi:ornithine cyclodeaminase/alanine dehydrogenase-like protein (mu-crystallin family)
VAGLLSPDDCITAVEAAFRAAGQGLTGPPAVLGMAGEGGGFHIKAARLGRHFAVKTNANFPDNGARNGLPTIQGVIVLCDAVDGRPLALLDSAEITALRTAAATAVAARYLARPDAGAATICGCGVQGRAQLRALSRVRSLTRVYAHDAVPQAARRFAREMTAELGVPVVALPDFAAVSGQTHIWVTCTPSRRFFLRAGHVVPGAFVAGVGADHPEKQELDPELLATATVVTDVRDQCAAMGDLHHAIAAGRMRLEDVHADLGEVVVGRRAGRTAPDEIIVFDSTGTALQDVAAAAVVYQRAVERGVGLPVTLGD